jgi:signal transduction histidine kinase
MHQLFHHLIDNAIKFRSPDTSPVIKVSTGNDPLKQTNLFVQDNGIGFEEIYLEKIFQPFQRLHGRQDYPGSGIGLAICKKILERHGGTIYARSEPGMGTTLIIELPTHLRFES